MWKSGAASACIMRAVSIILCNWVGSFVTKTAFFITNSRRIIASLYERVGLFVIRYGGRPSDLLLPRVSRG